MVLCAGAALSGIRAVADNNGLEAVRRLCSRYEPRSRNRALALLDGVLHPDLGADNADVLIDKLIKWGSDLRMHETNSGAPLADDVRIATLMRSV